MFLFGLVLTSFIQAVIYRIIHSMNWWSDRSRCEHCNHVLSWKDLIPVVSYLMLQGRCRYCRQKIPWIYPIMELLGGMFFIYSYHYFGYTNRMVVVIILYCLFLAMAIIDYKTYNVYSISIVLYFFIALYYRMITIGFEYVFFDICVFLLPLLICVYIGGMGGGDVEFIVCTSILLGSLHTLIALLLSCLIALVYALIHYLKGKKIRRLPFIPFLALGTMLTFFYGTIILRYYLLAMYIS